MQSKTLNYFSHPIAARKAYYEKYRHDIQNLINDRIHSSPLSHLQETPKIFTNLLVSISILGLFYLAATAKHRGTFWLKENTAIADTLRKISTDMSDSPTESRTSKMKPRQ
ncbi:MAG TPA: hypothetical protein VHA13_00845 [Gammaproteobacteria bacterium]|nr:hypothetical protein [Gammaproteobacteria bacterium]